MRTVVVMGKGDLAISVAGWFLHSQDYKLFAIVPVVPEPVWTNSFANWGRANGIQVVESGHYKDLPGMTGDDGNVDLAVSVFYDKIIKAWFIEKCKKIINLHNGPLPKYRGVSPINWALKNEEVEHGVTIHEITPGIDDGPIIAQLKYSIYPEFDEVIDVYKRSLEYGRILFEQTIPLIDKIKPRQQNHEKASYYSKLENSALEERSNFTREASESHLRSVQATSA
ncbi:MAG TPA: formyltransferase family protein [Terriglobales bacterium]|nr:formyltransferase family protein [Terriglobales bacterium]